MGRNVLIVGASGDIGIAIAKERMNQGDQLILHFHTNRQVLTELLQEVENDSVLQIVPADLTSEEGIEKLISQVAFSVDSIIFASGKADFGLFQFASKELMDQMLNLHVRAPWLVTRHFLSGMIKNQDGKIILITSVWGEVGASNEVLYSTVKGAQNSFVKALAKEVFLSNITVHGVSPGFIDTKMNLSLSKEEKDEIYAEIPLKRAGFPHEVAKAVNFLMDRPGNTLNGQVLQVSGGWMI